MKELFVIAAIVLASQAERYCAPDMYKQDLLAETAYAGPKPGSYKYNITSYTDFKNKLQVAIISSGVTEYQFFNKNESYMVRTSASGETCTKGMITTILRQCIPDDATVQAKYTNMAGLKVQVLQYSINDVSVDMVTENGYPSFQTIKTMRDGIGSYTTQLFTTYATTFNPDVFTLPKSCL